MLEVALLNRDPKPLSPEHGAEKPRSVAVIDEQTCIGCTFCIHACPVDAIIGAAKLMHTVIEQECTGCELCLAPCPVDCISMRPVAVTLGAWKRERADLARRRHRSQVERRQRERQERAAKLRQKTAAAGEDAKKAAIQAAVARAKAKKAGAGVKIGSEDGGG